MDQNTLPEEILDDLRQMCDAEPSKKLCNLVKRFLRCKHRVGSGPVTIDVLAMLVAVSGEIKANVPAVVNPFSDTPWGTPLSVLRMDSKEVLCDGFWMGVGEGMMSHLVKVAMHNDEREAQEFDFRQIRLRNALPVRSETVTQGPLVVVPDELDEDDEDAEYFSENTVETLAKSEPETGEHHSTADVSATSFEDSDVETKDTSNPSGESVADPWALIGEGSIVWIEDGSEGEYLGRDAITGLLKVRVDGRHIGGGHSLYEEDTVRVAEAIPIEHDPVEVGVA